jgi:surface antigen
MDSHGLPSVGLPSYRLQDIKSGKSREKPMIAKFARARILSILIAGLVLAGCQSTSGGRTSNKGIGTVLGAVVGAVVGSQLGDGAGKAVATLVGAAAGAVIGQTIGVHLDEADRKTHQAMVEKALDDSQTGQSQQWSNHDNKTSGKIKLLSSYQNDEGKDCHSTEMEITIEGETENENQNFCMMEGNWVPDEG